MAVANLEVKKNQPTLKKLSKKGAKKSNKSNADVLLLEQELKFAKVLAGNDKKLRDRVLKNLRKWLGYRSQSSFRFKEEDFMRIWKGLFYCMWMSDKPLIQEELADNISTLIHSFTNINDAILFFDCYLKTMVREWFGIDMHRLNKFMMFVRRMLRQFLVAVDHHKWKSEILEEFESVLTKTLFQQNNAMGLVLHFIEIFMEELAKASKGEIQPKSVTALLKPFAVFLAENVDARVGEHISQNIFLMLLQQSDAGIEYQEKFEAWKRQGFPGGSIDCMQKVEIDGSEDDEELSEILNENLDISSAAQDPRAGHVDVVLPQIQFDASSISDMLDGLIFGPKTSVKSRKQLRYLVQKFKKFNEGEFPLGLKKISKCDMKKLDVKKAASELEKFEQELYADSSKNKKRKKNIVTGNEPIKQSDKANVLSDQKKNTIAKKRKSNELLINGVNKKVKRSSNEWKVESLPNSKTTLNNSATPSINGSVLDISSENVTSTPEQSKTNKNKKTKLKKAVDKSNEKILHISTDNINPTTKPPIKLENKLSKSENNLSISKKHSLLNRRTDNGKTKPIKNKLKKTNNQTNEKNIHEVNESAWDEPLKEGEIEYFVPFRKTVAQKTVVPEKEESPLKTNNPISNKRRNSLPENLNVKKKEKLLLNPFAVASSKNPLVQAETPKSKMKISFV
ncbi:ribosomal RNA processing protein 1 homolog [Ctenocephalides felis]|uniref:ribosomal RNA processing protein 1 homolog n=1 Tax=Ctenocephalides felis TaxID=7515 RepID=UPI000E6E18DD|nr:ribosomal RNA processing protein 1 homolog [Ctenocephalides felis]